MSDWNDEIRKRLAGLNLPPAREAEIVEELSQHLEDFRERSLQSGATNDEAYQAALLELPGADLLVRELRRSHPPVRQDPIVIGTQRRSNLIGDFWQDLAYACRTLIKTPAFT